MVEIFEGEGNRSKCVGEARWPMVVLVHSVERTRLLAQPICLLLSFLLAKEEKLALGPLYLGSLYT